MKGNNKKSGGGLIKRFVGNKNTVTILGILACVATLIIGYNYRVKVAIDPISVPYAKQNIPTRTLITDSMVGKIKISKTYTKNASNLVLNPSNVVKKYVSYKTSIPKNSLFYTEQLVEAEDMPDFSFSNIADGETVFSLNVDSKESFFNSIRAGDYIDLYIKGSIKEGDQDNILFVPFYESVRVLAVKDKKGNNILKNRLENGTPAELLFALPTEDYKILMLSQYIDDRFEIVPVIRNAEYTITAADYKAKQSVVEYIQSKRAEFQ